MAGISAATGLGRREVVFPGLGLLGSTTQGTHVGDFIFLGSQTPHDPKSGHLIMGLREAPDDVRRRLEVGIALVDVPEDRIRAQTWRALQNIAELLETTGSSLEKLVHLRLFLRDMRDARSAIEVVRAMIPGALPSTSVVGATGNGVDESIDVQIDAIALVADGQTERLNIFIPELSALTDPFPAATRAGHFVFTTPVAGVDPKTGELLNRIADLEPEDRDVALRIGATWTRGEERLVAQHLAMWRNIRHILASQGIPFENILHQNGWLRISMQEFPPLARIRRELFGLGPGRTAATSFPMSGVRHEGAAFEYEVIAVVPTADGAGPVKEIKVASHGVGPYYLAAVQASPFVFTAGEVAVDASVPKHIDRAADLDDEMRLLPYGRVHAELPIMAQAHYVYKLLFAALEQYGCRPTDVVHQTVYMVNVDEYPALERIGTLYYGSKLPPTTLVPIIGTSPFKQATLEIELIAVPTAGS